MGLIIDLDCPATVPVATQRACERKSRPRIEADTPIVPRAVVESVWEEACVWLGEELPRGWVWRLTAQANAIYARNPRFRQTLRREGKAGRDWLWAFTRHWLAAMIWKHRRDLHARLPAAYNVGRELPDRP
jgi:hypothetical protein